jgi:hypothetical protein
MGKILRIVTGGVITAASLLIIGLCGYEVLQGQWLWIIIAIAGGAFGVAGIRIILGDRLMDILKDLLFVFVRTH